jgi:dGTPase
VRRAPQRLAGCGETAAKLPGNLKKFLFTHVYCHPAITEDRDRSVACLEELFQYYGSTPGSMPEAYEQAAQESKRSVVVCDYIAGMTDQFLLRQHHHHFGNADS